jgi:dephospho-CoA kinase
VFSHVQLLSLSDFACPRLLKLHPPAIFICARSLYNPSMITLGITGSIGMGKSTVVQLLRDRHIPVHDADTAVHQLLAPHGAAVSAVANDFPHSIAHTTDNIPYIDRAKLSSVLHDKTLLKQLENILHPLVFADMDDFKDRMQKSGTTLIAFDIPLLFETQAEDKVDMIICVSAPAHIQQERVMARPHMTLEKFHTILAQQMPDADKRARSDYILENDGDITHLQHQLDDILTLIHTQHHEDKSS